jgi:glycine dehydrogenase
MQIMKARLEEHYPILYSGEKGRAAHEMIRL